MDLLPRNGFQVFPSGVANIQIYLGRLQENVDQIHPAVFEELNDGSVAVLVLGVQHPPHCKMFTELSQTFLNTLSNALSNPVVDSNLNNTSAFRIHKIKTQVRILEHVAHG